MFSFGELRRGEAICRMWAGPRDQKLDRLAAEVKQACSAAEEHLRCVHQASDFMAVESEFLAAIGALAQLRRAFETVSRIEGWADQVEMLNPLDAAVPGLGRRDEHGQFHDEDHREERRSWWRSPQSCGFLSSAVGEVDLRAAVHAARRLAEAVSTRVPVPSGRRSL